MSSDQNSDFPSIEGYHLIRRLGRGGMATVYLAQKAGSQKQVAIKVMGMHLSDDNNWARRFILEAQVIAKLSHPGIVPVYDVGESGGQFYIAMEFLEGGSLKDRQKQGISLAESIRIMLHVAAALDFAGEQGFVHRDIKPDNIMFHANGAPVILDFGIAKNMEGDSEKMTQTGVIIGTTAYMSPEQAQGRTLDQRSDIYSLGIMFYELLTGKVPFKGNSDVETLMAHLKDIPAPLSEQYAPLQPIIDRMLAKDPDERYARGRDLLADLERIEPELRAVVNACNQERASRETMVHRKVGSEDATVTMSTGNAEQASTGSSDSRATGQITSQEELTKVLSSAKATIRDFSVENRSKQQRRSKTTIFAATALAIGAVCFLAYYQFYVIPQQQGQAEAQVREAKAGAQEKIARLLSEASAMQSNAAVGLNDDTTNIVQHYRDVLQIDPENAAAKNGLYNLVNELVAQSEANIRSNDIDTAIAYRDYAQKIAVDSERLESLNDKINEAQSKNIERSIKSKNVEALLAVAAENMNANSGWSDAAYLNLQQVFAIDAKNAKAQTQEKQLIDATVSAARADIVSGNLSRAKSSITALERYYPSTTALASLNADLKQKRSSISQAENLRSIEQRVSELKAAEIDPQSNRELAELYTEILTLNPKHNAAKAGLKDVANTNLAFAHTAMSEGDHKQAAKHISDAKTNGIAADKLASAQAALNTAKSNRNKANTLLQEAETLSDVSLSDPERRRSFKQALALIDEAKQLDNNNQKVASLLESMESKYLSVISELAAEEETDLVQEYLEDASVQSWPSDRLLNLRLTLAAQKPKKTKKRVVSGGF